MKIALASYEFINNDLNFNLNKIKQAIRNSKGADLLCFGEAFLQGFDSLSWDYKKDKEIAVSLDSEIMSDICALSKDNNIDLMLGYYEKEEDIIYSSYLFIEKGDIKANYRRYSASWKEDGSNKHYQEGREIIKVNYHGLDTVIALCGDLWLYPELYKANDLLIWPIYVNFSLDQWQEEEKEYAYQANLVAPKTVMINSLSKDPDSVGGAYYFEKGRIKEKIINKEDILLINI